MMLSLYELVYAVVTGLALVAGFVIEWRRGGNFEGRLAALEQQNLGARVEAIEATHDRMRRAV